MHLIPCFQRPATIVAVAALLIAMVASTCSAGDSPSASSPASPVATTATAAQTASLAPSEPSAVPSEPPATTATPVATEPPATPAPTPTTVPGPPATPGGLDYQVERGVAGEGGLVMTRYTVTWAAPLDPGTSISVFGVTTCPAKRTPSDPPCVTESTSLPAKIRELIVKGPAMDGSISWEWPEADVDGPVLAYADGTSYFAFVVRAVNAAGRSPFAVVVSTVACSDCMS